ncbi:MAG: M23 family metallopeptidase [Bryobacteraceae bacterium]|nr:M23 family metallopeptidase [Bryobacteraceae bacterium]
MRTVLLHAGIALVHAAIAAAAGTCELARSQVRQGDVIRLTCDAQASSARLLDREFPLFIQADGKALGMLPVAAGTPPGPRTIAVRTGEGRLLETLSFQVVDARFPEQNVTLSKSTLELAPAPGETERLRAFRQLVTPERFWTEPFIVPVPGCMTSPFGVKRMHNGKPTGNYHGGVDQRSPAGRPIRAPAAGIVRLAGMFTVPGNFVGIDHGQGLTSSYAHMSEVAVSEGARVEQGDVLGYVGSTGRSSAPHLHWGLAAHGVNINPLQWVPLKPCAAAKPAAKPKPRPSPPGR